MITKWEEYIEKLLQDNDESLSGMVYSVDRIKNTDITIENSAYYLCEVNNLRRKTDDIYKEKIYEKDYSQNYDRDEFDFVFKTALDKLREKIEKVINPKNTRWQIFKNIAKDFYPESIVSVTELFDKYEKKTSDISNQEVVSILKEKIDEIKPDIRNLSYYDSNKVVNEFKKRLKIFINRCNRVINSEFGKWLKERRKSKNISLTDLENLTGFSPSYISRIESGERSAPSLPACEKIITALGSNSDEILSTLNMNIGVENKSKNMGLIEVLILNNFLLNGEKATDKEKDAIIEILRTVLKSDWSNESRESDIQDLIRVVSKFKAIEHSTKKD